MTAGPVHVVHVTEALGGVETYLRLIVDHWAADARLSFVLPCEGDFATHLRGRGHAVVITPIPRTRWRVAELRSALRLKRQLRALAPDIVHLHSSQAGLVGRLACLGSRHPVVYTPHAYHYLGRRGVARHLYRTAELVLGKLRPTYVLATSPSEVLRARQEVKVPAGRVVGLLNAVELSATSCRTAGRPFRVGLVARISEQKNPRMYLRVVRRLSTEFPENFDFHLVGVGHYDGDLQHLSALLTQEGVEDLLSVTPWMTRERLLTWLSTCDAVVLTSSYESFGYTLAEATARAVPVVGTDVDGIRDVVREGVNGHLVPPGDDRAMADRLIRLMSDPEHYGRLSRGAIETAASQLDIRRFVGVLADYYEELRD